ncbi:MAG: DMT family transporter [Desulfobacterales bacterium]|nr:DMT family transporter [Desulfobacterales bacterium]
MLKTHNSNSEVKSKPLLPIFAILGAVLLWGSSFSAMRVVLRDLSPFEVMSCRLIVALICILPFVKRLIPKDYQKGDWKILILMVLFQPCLYFLFESRALQLTTSSQAGIISACVPLMVAFAAWIFLSESISSKTIIGLVLSIVGVILLTMFQSTTGTASNPVLGNILEFGAMVCATFNIILIKKLSDRYNTWTLTAMQVFAGALFFIPGSVGVIHQLKSNPSVFTFQTIALLLFLGSFVSLAAFGLYNYGISKIPASKAGIFINLIPVTAVLLGWIVLNEVLNTKQCIAACIVILGVFLSNNK